jgi:hypothetical protein
MLVGRVRHENNNAVKPFVCDKKVASPAHNGHRYLWMCSEKTSYFLQFMTRSNRKRTRRNSTHAVCGVVRHRAVSFNANTK